MNKVFKTILIFLFFYLKIGFAVAQSSNVNKDKIVIKKERIADTLIMQNRRAYYLGNNRDEALIQFFEKNKKLPNDIEPWFNCDVIYVQFFINDSGSVTKVRTLNKIKGCEGCAKEAERVAKLVPNNFFPAVENNKYVSSINTYAITFKRNAKAKCP